MRTDRRRMKNIALYPLFILLCAVIISPVYLAVILPFRSPEEINDVLEPLTSSDKGFSHIGLFAQYPTIDSFRELLVYTPEFYKVFWNSMLIVGGILFFQLLTGIPSAWAFSRFDFRGKKLLFDLYVIFMLLPFQVTMLSQYIMLDKLSLINTRLAVMIPAIFSTFPVFMIYRGFADIPGDIADSARIDGANEWQVLRHIGLPLGMPGILACVVLCFLDLWNMVEQPLAFIKDKKLYPLSLYLPMLDTDNGSMMLAAAAVTLIPAAFVFIIGQDHLEHGIISSALKE